MRIQLQDPSVAPGRLSWRLRLVSRLCAVAGLLLAIAAAHADEAEAQRLANEEFYRGLIELRLHHLLDHHLRVHPPEDELTELLLRRQMHLSIATDNMADTKARYAALTAANAILARVIQEHGADERAIQWQLDLVTSLIYEEAEPYYTSILFRGATPEDRTSLLALMEQTTEILTNLSAHLEREYARIDELSLTEYERLEDTGYVTRIETAMPQAEYMSRWARFYKALAMESASAERRALLTDVLDELTNRTSLLTDDHSVTHTQAQSLLLAAMCCRRLSDHESAARMLQDAIRITASISNPQERNDLRWLILLASVERVGALIDSGQVDPADQAFHEFKAHIERTGRSEFAYELVQALLAGRIAQVRAGGAVYTGDSPFMAPMPDAAIRPLMELADKLPAYRDEIYATLYNQLRHVREPRRLHPFQQCVLIAGDIAAANRLRHVTDPVADPAGQRDAEAQAIALLDQAIALAQGLTESGGEQPGSALYCEALYNRAVAEHHRGQRADAARRFSSVAKECPGFSRALAAATYGVEIAAQLAEDPSLRARPEVQQLLLSTLDALVSNFAGNDAAEYWRFFFAQALEDTGKPDAAAEQYARVRAEHDHFHTAQFRAARCQVESLTAFVVASPEDLPNIKRRAGNARKALDDFKSLNAELLKNPGAAGDREALGTLIAEADVLLAEMNVLPGVDRPAETLSQLAGFETRFPDDRALLGRVLRARIIAYEATGQLKEAKDAVPEYIASDPKHAGATLQTLFDVTWAEIERYRSSGRSNLAEKKAQSALLFADQIYTWATSRPDLAGDEELYTLRLQLAEASLVAGQPADALKLFQQCEAQDKARYEDGLAHTPRVVMGLADTLFRLEKYGEALLLYNRVYVEAPQGSQQRFAALLGDVRCRTELGEDPVGIVNVIRQHRFLNPSMGGDDLKAKFAELQERNERRGGDNTKP